MPTTPSAWAYFVQRLQDYINFAASAAGRTHVNCVPSGYTVYNGTTLPPVTLTGCTAALDSTHAQFGAASMKLTATAATVEVQFSGTPLTLQAYQRWIESVYLMTSRSSITGTLAVTTGVGTYSVNIDSNPTPATWVRLYGTQDLSADASTAATLELTLTGCSVGDTFNLEAWQFESASGGTNLPSPWVNTNPVLVSDSPGSVRTFQSGSVSVLTSISGQVTTNITLPNSVNTAKALVAISSNSAVSNKDAPATMATLTSSTNLQLVTDMAIGGAAYNINVDWQVLEWM